MHRYVIVFAVLLANLACSKDNLQVKQELEKIADSNNLVGMSVLVAEDGAIANCYHYGKADKAREIPVSEKTLYRIASISKTVTATALMQLYEHGEFALDDDVNDYLGFSLRNPSHPDKPVTFRMLLSHTAGLRDGKGYKQFRDETYGNPAPPHLKQLLVTGNRYFTADMWGKQAPGAYFTYANINYGIVSTLIEQISGRRFDRYVRREVLEPLGISGSFNVRDLPNINNLAVLYRNGAPQKDNFKGEKPQEPALQEYTPGTNGLVFSPQGGLRISAQNMAKFMLMHAQNGTYKGTRILKSSTAQLMRKPQWTYNENNGNNYYNLFNQWGLGFHLITNKPKGDIVIPGMRFIGHPGQAYGLISDMYFNPEAGFGLIFLTNGYSGEQGYQTGERSAFYMPEEQVYQVIARNYSLK